MSNRKAVEPDEFPDDLLKMALDGDRDGTYLAPDRFHAIAVAIWQGWGRTAEVEKCHDHS